MMLSNRVIFVHDFWRLLTPSPVKLQHISKQVDLCISPWSEGAGSCLAYGRGKVAVAGPYGVFVFVLDSIFDRLGEFDLPPGDFSLQSLQPTSPEHKPSRPNLQLREVQFDDPKMFNSGIVSCLQLTETKLYLSVLSDNTTDERGENMWCCDFALSPSAT